jgi:deoxyuridine 5'-triphosphate nucleotidohydrolase
MDNIQIKFVKTHPDAILPQSAYDTDSGYDIYAVENKIIYPGDSAVVPVGLTVAYITPGYWFRIEARSGLGFKHSIQPHFGIVDNFYRGDLSIKLYNNGNMQYTVQSGDRIAQLVVYKLIKPEISWADEVEQTSRGDNKLGSTGR